MCSARTGSVCCGNYWRLVPLPPLWIHHRRGGSTTSTAKAAAMRGGGRAGAATSRMTAIAEGGIRRGRTHPWRRRTTMTAMSPARARPSPSHTIKQRQRRGGGGGGGEEEEAPVDDGICCMAGRGGGGGGGGGGDDGNYYNLPHNVRRAAARPVRRIRHSEVVLVLVYAPLDDGRRKRIRRMGR